MKEINTKSKKYIFRKAVVLLFTVVVFFSATIVTANTKTSNSDIATLEISLLDESFEDGVMPPDDWTLQVYQSSYTWQIVTEPVHGGTRAAQCPSRGSKKQMEWLISPEIDLSGGFDEATLIFWCNSKCQYSEGTVKLYIDKDNDGFDDPEDVVWDMMGDEDWEDYMWREKTFDLTEYLETTIKIAWYYFADLKLPRFTLDEIKITTPGYIPKTSLKLGKISAASGYVYAEIKNTGNVSAKDVQWSMSINGGMLGRISKSLGGTIDRIKAFDMETVSGATFFGIGKVTITVEAECDNAIPKKVSRTVTGFVFFSKFYPMIW